MSPGTLLNATMAATPPFPGITDTQASVVAQATASVYAVIAGTSTATSYTLDLTGTPTFTVNGSAPALAGGIGGDAWSDIGTFFGDVLHAIKQGAIKLAVVRGRHQQGHLADGADHRGRGGHHLGDLADRHGRRRLARARPVRLARRPARGRAELAEGPAALGRHLVHDGNLQRLRHRRPDRRDRHPGVQGHHRQRRLLRPLEVRDRQLPQPGRAEPRRPAAAPGGEQHPVRHAAHHAARQRDHAELAAVQAMDGGRRRRGGPAARSWRQPGRAVHRDQRRGDGVRTSRPTWPQNCRT